MKSTLFVGSLIATSALAKPVVEKLNEKRSYFTVTEVDTVYATVTGSPDSGWGWWDGWHGSPGSTVAAVTTTTEEAPVPVVTETPMFTMSVFTPPPAPVETPPASAPPPPPPPPAPVEPSAPSVPTPAPSSTNQGTGPGGVDIGAILDQHNLHRQNASVPSLTWSDDMASIAAEIAASCTYAHNTQAGGGGYGQNIGAGAPPQDVPAMITNEMYNGEINFYPLPYGVEPDMSNFESWGHYSQIVWKNTVSVGCAVQDCSATGLSGVGSGVSAFFSVCNYSPPGNFGGEYGANVLAPDGGLATETVPN